MSASSLRVNDVVLVEAGEYIPSDGEVIEGVASVDESAVTGESAPVIRESGGDRSSVTGGTRVLSDWILVRVTTNPGETFLDQMISLVEGAKRQKTPNEIALDILLAALTIHRNTEYATAEGLWRSALERWPSALAHRNLATSLRQLGRGNEAIEHLRATLTEHPEMRVAVGQTLFEQGRFDEAVTELRTFLDRTAVPGTNDEANARVVAATSLERMGRSAEARDMLQELIARRPDYAPAYLAIGDVHFRRSEFADAQRAYRQYLTYEPGHEGALTNLGISALNAGQLDEGIKALQRVVDARPQLASAHRNLAIALANAGRIDQAIGHVKEAARLAPADAAIRELSQQLQAAKPVNP